MNAQLRIRQLMEERGWTDCRLAKEALLKLIDTIYVAFPALICMAACHTEGVPCIVAGHLHIFSCLPAFDIIAYMPLMLRFI